MAIFPITDGALTHKVGATKLQFAWVRGLWNVHFYWSFSVLETVQKEYIQSTPYVFFKSFQFGLQTAISN